jgi:hypothetical protein
VIQKQTSCHKRQKLSFQSEQSQKGITCPLSNGLPEKVEISSEEENITQDLKLSLKFFLHNDQNALKKLSHIPRYKTKTKRNRIKPNQTPPDNRKETHGKSRDYNNQKRLQNS